MDPEDIDIWYGSRHATGSNGHLSNLAARPFSLWIKGKEETCKKGLNSVEHGYQTLKSGSFDEVVYNAY